MSLSFNVVSSHLMSPSAVQANLSLVNLNKKDKKITKKDEQNIEMLPYYNICDPIMELLKYPTQLEIQPWWEDICNKALYSECENIYTQFQFKYLRDPNLNTFKVVQNFAIKIIHYWFSSNSSMKVRISEDLLKKISKGNLWKGSENIPLIIFLTSQSYLNMGLNMEEQLFKPIEWKEYFVSFPTRPQWILKEHRKALFKIKQKHYVFLSDMIEVVSHNIGNFLYKPSEKNLLDVQENMLILTAFLKWEKQQEVDASFSFIPWKHKENRMIAAKITTVYKFLIMPPLMCGELQENRIKRHCQDDRFQYIRRINLVSKEYQAKKNMADDKNMWIELDEPRSLRTIAWSNLLD